MANFHSQLLFILLIFTISSAVTTNYFQGVPIDAALIANANLAISDLRNVLFKNYDCSQPAFSLRGSFGYNMLFGQFHHLNDPNQYQYFSPTQKYNFFSGFNLFGGYQLNSDVYKKASRVAQVLEDIKIILCQYNNIVIGDNNTVIGNNNFVVGSQDNLLGNNNWVFASNFNSTNPEDGVLIIEVYVIELDELFDLLANPLKAIKCVKQEDSNQRFGSWWNGAKATNRFCF